MNEKDFQAEYQQLVMNYKSVFLGPGGGEVLKDLEEFCHYRNDHCMRPTERATCFALGERNVFIRILNMVEEDLLEGRPLTAINDEEVKDDG